MVCRPDDGDEKKNPGSGGGGQTRVLGTERDKLDRLCASQLVIQMSQKHGDAKNQLHAEYDQSVSNHRQLVAQGGRPMTD
jgi:hypothetical protein